MEIPKSLLFFDFHNHPFTKGSVSRYQQTDLSWDPVEMNSPVPTSVSCFDLDPTDEYYIPGDEIMETQNKSGLFPWLDIGLMVRQIFNSQAPLKQLKERGCLAISSLIAMEQAYAETWFLRCLLPLISPLNGDTVKGVIKKLIQYNFLFNEELKQVLATKKKKEFYILKSINDFKENNLNTILAIEGAHNLQSQFDHEDHIPGNLKKLKNNTDYRFLYLTLTHLTRQPAAVHCFGTYIRKGINLTPNFKYQPDPRYKGISKIGKQTIEVAYDPDPYSILIDIKHMSYVSRCMFYQMREDNPKYKMFPIIATHMGVTGHSFEDAIVEKIEFGGIDDNCRLECDRVFWVPTTNPYLHTRFNPWTINLFDNDILKILESNGLIGLNLDQRILGVGKFPGEFMSPLEVKDLPFGSLRKGIDTSESEGLNKFEKYYDPNIPIALDPNFQLTEGEIEDEKRYMRKKNPRHIDYLANNIIHIMKVGFKAGYNGKNLNQMNVCKAICIGSDLDGMTDPVNLPKRKHGKRIDHYNYVTAGKFDKLRTELDHSLGKFLRLDEDIRPYLEFIPDDLMDRVCFLNGWEFLDKNFR